MSTSFNFPPDPTLNQIVVLPDGNQAQWNGSAWVSVVDNATYPLAVAKGGTGATSPAGARINLGLNSATGEFIVQKDGTALLPGMSFVTQPDLGFFRLGANVIGVTSQGKQIAYIGGGSGGDTAVSLNAWSASGASHYYLTNQPVGTANYNVFALEISGTGGASIRTAVGGSATRASLTIDSPQVYFLDGSVAAPSIAFSTETGLGFWHSAANSIRMATGGKDTYVFSGVTTGSTFTVLPQLVNCPGRVELRNQPSGSVNFNSLSVVQNTDGSASISTAAAGSATRSGLYLDASFVSSVTALTVANQIFINAAVGGNWSVLTLNAAVTATSGTSIEGRRNGSQRWAITMPDSTAESGANAGSDFAITRYNDAGTWLGASLAINRKTGNVTAQGLTRQVDHDELRERTNDLTAKLEAALARITALEKY